MDKILFTDAAREVAKADGLKRDAISEFAGRVERVAEAVGPKIEEAAQARVQAAVDAERERLRSIAGHDEASGRETLALELACSGLDPEAALKILRETPAPANGRGLLDAAMQGYRPNVSADCADWTEQSEEERAASEILNAGEPR